jgi:hypothetical protein
MQAVAARPRQPKRSASVSVQEADAVRAMLSEFDAQARTWALLEPGVNGEGAVSRSGVLGEGLLPLEAAVLDPLELPIWGRWHDDWLPIDCDVLDANRVRITVEHRGDRSIVGAVVVDVEHRCAESVLLPPTVVKVTLAP